MTCQAYIYILTNKNKTVLYIGSTANIERRIREHKSKRYPLSFTAQYNIDRLVYFDAYPSIREARNQEFRLKKKKRVYKEQLISRQNANWEDLAEDW